MVANLVTQFDVSLAPGEDGPRFLENAVDHFTVSLAPLRLCFTKRT